MIAKFKGRISHVRSPASDSRPGKQPSPRRGAARRAIPALLAVALHATALFVILLLNNFFEDARTSRLTPPLTDVNLKPHQHPHPGSFPDSSDASSSVGTPLSPHVSRESFTLDPLRDTRGTHRSPQSLSNNTPANATTVTTAHSYLAPNAANTVEAGTDTIGNDHVVSHAKGPTNLASQRSFLALSVDDFGRSADSIPLQPDTRFMTDHPELVLPTTSSWNPWYVRATVETKQDLLNLKTFLEALNHQIPFNQRIVLTPLWVVGGPDYDGMRAAGCRPGNVNIDHSQQISRRRSQVHRPPNINWNMTGGQDGKGPEQSEQTAGRHSSSRLSSHPQTDPDVSQAKPPVSQHDSTKIHSSSETTAASHPQPSSYVELARSTPNGYPAAHRTTTGTRNSMEFDPGVTFRPRPLANDKPISASTGSKTGRCHYREQLLSDTSAPRLQRHPYYRGDLRSDYLSLWEMGMWHPEYHGRSHFNVENWLQLLDTDPVAQQCFDQNMVCASDPRRLRSEFTGFESSAELAAWINDGVQAFSSFFGYRPEIISSPHNRWSTQLADTSVQTGFLGAELAENQESSIPHLPQLSLHDRYRFDVFFPGFDCDKAIDDIVRLLSTPKQASVYNAVSSRLWSALELFHKEDTEFSLRNRDGNHARFVSLMWHAQNMMSSTYTRLEYTKHMQCLDKVVRTVRLRLPRAVFVTVSELHQIRSRGWSREVWHDSIVVRNFLDREIRYTVPDLGDWNRKSPSWRGRLIQVERLSSSETRVCGDEPRIGTNAAAVHSNQAADDPCLRVVLCGEDIIVPSDSVFRLRLSTLNARSG